MKRVNRHLALAVTFFGVTTAPAYAYLDPGTGSIILQSVIGAVAAGLFLARSYLYRLRSWLVTPKPGKSDRPSPE